MTPVLFSLHSSSYSLSLSIQPLVPNKICDGFFSYFHCCFGKLNNNCFKRKWDCVGYIRLKNLSISSKKKLYNRIQLFLYLFCTRNLTTVLRVLLWIYIYIKNYTSHLQHVCLDQLVKSTIIYDTVKYRFIFFAPSGYCSIWHEVNDFGEQSKTQEKIRRRE